MEEEEEEEGEENQSFQTMLFDAEDVENSLGEAAKHVTSFYGPEKPQYEEMVSIIQGEPISAEMIDERILNQIDQVNARTPTILNALQIQVSQDDNDTGGGSVAASTSPHSIRHVTIKGQHSKQQLHDESIIVTKEDDEDEEDDQFLFAQNLNKQYADAIQQRKFMKLLNKPRQKSC